MKKPYRPCVVGVFRDQTGQVMVLERLDTPGAWQFPQGGIEDNETPEIGLIREMAEELGTKEFSILARSERPVNYDWPDSARGKYKDLFSGQAQWWFLLEFEPGASPKLSEATDPEFSGYRWVDPQLAVEGIIEWKREAYRIGLRLLGIEVE